MKEQLYNSLFYEPLQTTPCGKAHWAKLLNLVGLL